MGTGQAAEPPRAFTQSQREELRQILGLDIPSIDSLQGNLDGLHWLLLPRETGGNQATASAEAVEVIYTAISRPRSEIPTIRFVPRGDIRRLVPHRWQSGDDIENIEIPETPRTEWISETAGSWFHRLAEICFIAAGYADTNPTRSIREWLKRYNG